MLQILLIGSSNYFWRDSNHWNAQGCVENDASIDNIQKRHDGSSKYNSSSTTMNDGRSKKQTIIIDPRANQGDTQNYTYEVDELYMASANSDGDVGQYTIFISNGGQDSAINPNNGTWQQVASGTLTEDGKLFKVHSGNLRFKYLKIEMYSRNKYYTELAAIKGFKKVTDSNETVISAKKENNKIKVLAANQNIGIKEIKVIRPDGGQNVTQYNNFGVIRYNYNAVVNGQHRIIVTNKDGAQKEIQVDMRGI